MHSRDSSKPYSFERTVYVSIYTRPGDAIRYGDWRDTPGPHTWYDGRYVGPGNALGSFVAHGVPFTLIELATGSDYSGNLVEKSNHDVLHERFPWLVTVLGFHGTFGIGYLGKRENQNPELLEALDDLDGYPLADDEHHSNLEHETADQAWEDDGRKDWKRALVKLWSVVDPDDDSDDPAPEYDEDRIPDDRADAVWYACTERLCGGESYTNESGDSIYFPISNVIDKIRRDWPGLYDPFTWGDDPRPLIEQLEKLRTLALVPANTSANRTNKE